MMIVRIKWTPILGRNRQKRRFRPWSDVVLGGLLLAYALPVSTIADVRPKPIEDRIVKRTETLTSFMRRKQFVEPYNLPVIMQSASKASIPPSLIVCIEFVESSGGKYYDADTNNPLGWNNGKTSFPSIPAAIRHVSWQLGSGPGYAGKTLEEKLRVYNPRPYYSEKVLGCMSQFSE
jgi:hypothetical protein